MVILNLSMEDFNILSKLVTDLNKSNSIIDKKSTLLKYKDSEFVQKVLYYTYNPMFQYYVTPDILDKYFDIDLGELVVYDDVFELLDALRLRTISGHKAINSVNEFCFRNIEFKDLIYKIIGKDLEIRMGDSLINKVIPGLIPTFDVALASNFEDVKVNFSDQWTSSRKLDGVRCLAVIDATGNVSLWSRQGNEFFTLEKVKEELSKLNLRDKVLDGEICLIDSNGNEDFQGIMKQIRRKDHTIDNPKYLVFDIIDGSEFRSKLGTVPFSERYLNLSELLDGDSTQNFNYIDIVRQTAIIDEAHYNELINASNENNWEGLILRKLSSVYEGKRSKNMLKCKAFNDGEYIVKDLEFGPFRMIENGVEVTKEVLSNVIIEHKGNTVSVGSGFSIEEREYYKAHPDELLNKTITVKYFQESRNQNGSWSLRFPTVKVIHGSKRLI